MTRAPAITRPRPRRAAAVAVGASLLALAAAAATPACTFGLPLATSGVIWAHNGAVDHVDQKWSYGTAVDITAAIGLGVDLLLLKLLGDQWSKPMS